MTDITIPTVALEAGENAFCEAWDRDEPALLAFAIAMLKAWPGRSQLAENDSASIREMACFILPLPQGPAGNIAPLLLDAGRIARATLEGT